MFIIEVFSIISTKYLKNYYNSIMQYKFILNKFKNDLIYFK